MKSHKKQSQNAKRYDNKIKFSTRKEQAVKPSAVHILVYSQKKQIFEEEETRSTKCHILKIVTIVTIVMQFSNRHESRKTDPSVY